MDYRSFLVQALEQFVEEDPRNSMKAHGGVKVYDAPLVGFAAADDKMFERLKHSEVVGEFHRSPEQWLCGARTVISFFLPFTELIRKSNRTEGFPSKEWSTSRVDGEVFKNAMREFLVKQLEKLGYKAVCPPHTPEYFSENFHSNWSERHVAYTAGLGTFGLSRSLITEKGCAGRYGSVVTTLELEPTPRTAKTFYDACPFLVDGSCGDCIARCPVGAITAEGKDHKLCAEYIYEVVSPRAASYGCAKCQTGVPCEFARP